MAALVVSIAVLVHAGDCRVAGGEPDKPGNLEADVKLRGERVLVTAEVIRGRLRERYLARRTGHAELLKLSQQTVELALQAPGREGAFKCIAVRFNDGQATVWAAGDGSGGSTKDGFLGYDMCWTGYWLLRWRAAELPGSEGILPRCRQLARFVMARQLADGMLPTRFAESGSVQEELSRTVKAETGPVVLFLLELYRHDQNLQYRDAAKKGLDFLEKEVLPRRQWYDYETFWSCSPRGAKFDERTQQWPANNLALTQTVAAYLAAFRITGQSRYLGTGEALLDYLLLYQQCWTNPGLDNLTWRGEELEKGVALSPAKSP